MPIKGKSFSIDSRVVDQIVDRWIKRVEETEKDLVKKMKASINIIYQITRTPRPKINARQQVKLGRPKKGYRVSDPNAILGVPVKTGTLRTSIEKEVIVGRNKVIGRVWTDSPYAKYVEFGTSRMQKRPFMRPALAQTREVIKKIFRAQVPR